MSLGTPFERVREQYGPGMAQVLLGSGPRRRLSVRDRERIRERWMTSRVQQKELASEYGVSRTTINTIINKRKK